MRKCRQCGGRLQRAHRSYLQRIGYLAIFACPVCRSVETVPRFSYRLGDACRCPRCGTSKLSKLKERDQIDGMEIGLWNLAARLWGGQLYHCGLCRLQFYDRRPLPPVKEVESVARPDPARTA